MGTHKATINRFAWMWNCYPFTLGEVASQKTSLSFVDSIWEMFGALLQGIPTYVVPDETVRDPEMMVRALDVNHVTRLVVVPSFLRTMLENCPDLCGRLARLRFWVTSGEELPFELYQRFRTAMPSARLLNLYGSSEVAADVTFFDTSNNEPVGFVPIGRPIANTRTYILDRYMKPVPVGVPGELYVGGDCLAVGYYNREDLTMERFVPDPFTGTGRLFKTGDLAQYGLDGEIQYLGRTDTQVKVRGIRIELGEIEAVLESHEAVRQAVVMLDPSGENRMVAYFVSEPGNAVDVGQLRRFVRSKLPEHMMPSSFLLLDALPLTPNGKVDRRSLPPVPKTTDHEHEYIAPRNETEQKLADIWSEVLRLDPIGIDDNFFEIGGHSLLAVKVIARVRKEFGVEVAMRSLFEEPTIAGFSRAIEKARVSGAVARVPQITRRVERKTKTEKEELLARLGEMSEEDIEALLQSALEKRTRPANV
jgi:acyl-coenzyme A synthetase/AMP-(fatty) acid ligase/acyl carrier protein